MEFLLIVVLIALNGVFAMSEMALAASRRARLQPLADAGDAGAQRALALMAQPNRFLSTIQIGITSIGVLNGIVGEAAFSDALAAWLRSWGVGERWAVALATAVVVSAITLVTIVLGELVPKRIGQLYPETVARSVARPMAGLARLAAPVVRLLAGATAALLRVLGLRDHAGPSMTEAEISASLDEGVDAGVIEAHEHQLVRNVFGLDDRPLASIMRPRAEIDSLAAHWSVAQALDYVAQAGAARAHSWYPVCEDSLDRVLGKVALAHLVALGAGADGPLSAHVQPAAFVPETLSGLELLEQFRTRAARLVFVVDEYGVVQGLLTPLDLMEAITGELKPLSADDAWATARADGSWLLDGVMPVAELKARLGLDELPDEARGRYNTLAGLLMAVSGHLPVTGEALTLCGWRFEVVDLDGKRIDKVLAQRQAVA